MSEFDLHNNIDDRVALLSQTISTVSLTTGEIIDTKGFESLEFIVIGTITDGDFEISLEEGDDAGLSDATTVSPEETLGDLTGFSGPGNSTIRVGSIGKKRYQLLNLSSTGVPVNGVFAAIALLGHPHTAPVAQ